MYFCDEPQYDPAVPTSHRWGPGMVRDFTDGQIASQSTWTAVGDREVADAAMHTVHISPSNGSTTTVVNQLLPLEDRWLEIPTSPAPVIAAPRW